VSSAKDVKIPLDYLVSTHILLSKAYEKMSQVMGTSQAMAFFSMASDYDPFGPLGGTEGDADRLADMLTAFGYKLEESSKGGTNEYRLWCPHADKVHPALGRGASFCPMSQLVLGAVRKKHRKSVVTESRLHADGSSFIIRVQD
jgi:hypothetical protein